METLYRGSKLGTELTWVDATYDSLHGPIQSRYELADGMVTLSIVVPPGHRSDRGCS